MASEAQEAEFVVRMALQGMTYILRIGGQGGEHIAAMLQASKNQPDSSPGKKRLAEMLKSGDSLQVFTIKENLLADFAKEAKRYGIQYCITERDDGDVKSGVYDLLVREIDAVRMNHIIERLGLGTVEGKIDTNVNETDKKKAVELTDAQRLMKDLFSPNKEERGENEAKEKENPDLESEGRNQSAGSYKSTDNRASVKDMLNESKLEADSTMDMFQKARGLRESMMSDAPEQMMSDVPQEMTQGWTKPPVEYSSGGERLFRGKTADQMTELDNVQLLVDNEMEAHGKLSEDFISKMFEAGYKVDGNGIAEKLETTLTSRERKLITEMMHEPGQAAKDFKDIKEAFING